MRIFSVFEILFILFVFIFFTPWVVFEKLIYSHIWKLLKIWENLMMAVSFVFKSELLLAL